MTNHQHKWDIPAEYSTQFYETADALIETLMKPEVLKRDILFSLLLVMMNQNDFLLMPIAQNNTAEGNSLRIVNNITFNKNMKGGIYEAEFIFNRSEFTVKLLMSPMQDVVIINTVIEDIKHRIYSLCLPIDDYFETSKLELPCDFKNIDNLFTEFKEKIIVPVKSSIVNYYKMPSETLPGLPTEVLRTILLMLSLSDVLNLSKSCKRINDVVNENWLWSRLYDRDFPNIQRKDKNVLGDSFMDLYKAEYKKKKSVKMKNNITEIETSGYMRYSCVPDPRLEIIL